MIEEGKYYYTVSGSRVGPMQKCVSDSKRYGCSFVSYFLDDKETCIFYTDNGERPHDEDKTLELVFVNLIPLPEICEYV